MNFSDIEGQRHIADILSSSLAHDRAGHAYLFTGPEGIGKKTVAGIFARLLLCLDEGAAKGQGTCGSCLPCSLAEAGTCPDLFTVRTEDESGILVEAIRALQADIIIKPVYSRKKVYIIEEADKMTDQAQNCLLKTLEEPPPYAVLILTATGTENFRETILSRVSRMDFRRNTDEEVRRALYKKPGKLSPNIDFIIAYAAGNIGLALKLEQSGDFAELREAVFDMVKMLYYEEGPYSMIYKAESFLNLHKEDSGAVFSMMESFYRDILAAAAAAAAAHEAPGDSVLINTDKKGIILNMRRPDGLARAAESIRIIGRTQEAVMRNVNFQLCISAMLMKLREPCI